MTTASENRGGDRPTAAQNNPANVSGVGGAGQSGVADLNYTGLPYGQNQAVNQSRVTGNAAVASTQPTPVATLPSLPSITPITAPSETPDRPITYGMPFGDGAGREVNPLPVKIPYEGDPSVDVIRALYAQNPRNEDLRYIVETIDARQQAGA
jgi:hypothetical protein